MTKRSAYTADDTCPVCGHPVRDHYYNKDHPSGYSRCSSTRNRCVTCTKRDDTARLTPQQREQYEELRKKHGYR